MAKTKSVFNCQNCGASYHKWMGKCTACEEWNTIVEEVVVKSKPSSGGVNYSLNETKPSPINNISIVELPRLELPIKEFNRVLGGGIVPGSLTLLGGEPGIGKSTIMLQISLILKGKKVLYISGEESSEQIKLRAERLSSNRGSEEFDFSNADCYIYPETNTQKIFTQIDNIQPELVVIDSIQTLHSDYIESTPGSISQIRECTAELMKYAKSKMVPIVLVGHITKDGNIAGPKVLEHMVDTVLSFEGERNHVYRIIRTIKNRFGSTNELGIFEMTGKGLIEVLNPSEILINSRGEEFSGIAIAASMEGMRPLLIETQALVSSAVYGTPQRSCTGFDLRRLSMLLAVLEKRLEFRLGAKDVFLNMAGGLKVEDPAIDLAVLAAILSSSEDISISSKTCFAGEVGLSGEIRPVTRLDQRISEAEKLGFEKIFVSGYSSNSTNQPRYNIEIIEAKKINDVFQELFG